MTINSIDDQLLCIQELQILIVCTYFVQNWPRLPGNHQFLHPEPRNLSQNTENIIYYILWYNFNLFLNTCAHAQYTHTHTQRWESKISFQNTWMYVLSSCSASITYVCLVYNNWIFIQSKVTLVHQLSDNVDIIMYYVNTRLIICCMLIIIQLKLRVLIDF